MEERDQTRIVEALRFALAAHGPQTRKGVPIPYASHLLQVAGLVLEAGGDAHQAAAALLHDTLEDCEDVDAAALRERFDADVVAIVEACTDTLPGDTPGGKSPWSERKARHLERLARAPARARLVAACDKLHNLRCLVADLRAEGPATLDRFNARPEALRGYYEAARSVLADALPAPLQRDFDVQLQALRRAVRPAGPRR